jgi:hypothetical protein
MGLVQRMLSEDELRDALLLVFANKQVGLCSLRLPLSPETPSWRSRLSCAAASAKGQRERALPSGMPYARTKAAEVLATARLDFQNGCRGIA